jgi:hypothetical protein
MKRDNLAAHRVARKKTKALACRETGNCRASVADALAFEKNTAGGSQATLDGLAGGRAGANESNALRHLQIELYHAFV